MKGHIFEIKLAENATAPNLLKFLYLYYNTFENYFSYISIF